MTRLSAVESSSRFTEAAMAFPMAVPSSMAPMPTERSWASRISWSRVSGVMVTACRANATAPNRSRSRRRAKSSSTSRATASRLAEPRSSALMLEERSSASTRSTPTEVRDSRVRPVCGLASARLARTKASSTSAPGRNARRARSGVGSAARPAASGNRTAGEAARWPPTRRARAPAGFGAARREKRSTRPGRRSGTSSNSSSAAGQSSLTTGPPRSGTPRTPPGPARRPPPDRPPPTAPPHPLGPVLPRGSPGSRKAASGRGTRPLR